MNFSQCKSMVLFALLAAPLLMLTGCAKYKATPLKRQTHHLVEGKNRETVSLTSTVFSKQDCCTYLGRNVIAKGYQPIHLSIVNNSSRRFQFALKNFSLETCSPDEVAETVYTSTMGRALGYGLASFIFPPFIVPAIVDGIKSGQANAKLDKDYERKALADQIIEPYATLEGLVFIPVACFDPVYTLTLIDVQNRERYTFAGPTSQVVFLSGQTK